MFLPTDPFILGLLIGLALFYGTIALSDIFVAMHHHKTVSQISK